MQAHPCKHKGGRLGPVHMVKKEELSERRITGKDVVQREGTILCKCHCAFSGGWGDKKNQNARGVARVVHIERIFLF